MTIFLNYLMHPILRIQSYFAVTIKRIITIYITVVRGCSPEHFPLAHLPCLAVYIRCFSHVLFAHSFAHFCTLFFSLAFRLSLSLRSALLRSRASAHLSSRTFSHTRLHLASRQSSLRADIHSCNREFTSDRGVGLSEPGVQSKFVLLRY